MKHLINNPRHERFAQELAKGRSASEAYVAAGFKANRAGASRLQHKTSVSQRVHELLAKSRHIEEAATQTAADALAIDRQWIMDRLKENVERALQAVQPLDAEGKPSGEYKYDGAVANRALELLGREIGMFIERREVGKPGSFEDLNAQERDKLLEFLDKELEARSEDQSEKLYRH
jgi:phage terminase small subunit